MSLSCKKCGKSIPLHKCFFKKITCGDCGALHKIDDSFSAFMGLVGILFGFISTRGEVFAILISLLVLIVLASFKYTNILQNKISIIVED